MASAAKTLSVALYQAPTHELSVWIKELAPMLAQMSNNELKAKVYDAGTIAKAREMIDAVQRNLADVGFVYPGFNSSTIPVMEVVGAVPFLIRNNYEWWKAWPKIVPVLQKALEDKGYDNIVVCAVPYYGGWYKIATKGKAVKVPDDLKGIKIKAVGKGLRDYVSKVGGSSVSISTAEVYEAASRGLLQGTIGCHTHWTGWKQMEVFDHLLDLPVAPTTMLFYINKSTLKKLGPKDAAVFTKFCEMTSAIITIDSMVSEAKNEMIASSKMKFYKPTQAEIELWYAPSKEVIAEWVKRSAPYGQEIVDIVEKVRNSKKKNFLNY
ncbi:MAG: TRAP transporter substrate-binding protein DctP [Desulfarculaceae bacterium]|nr:TRAP transporter substrate-binding protein DctP [Desulfarculaceae bacterium]MCF8073148.1 TRAP transporter substrate-binding protein DctP [Desulfarculaceae bacterium]MCF8101767.1 TRAP transporter substrate-binding protein DctP [Desulfarculaceae bacterium]MCF8118395.1 TRAP transporter substrate-binding protein DctP [Desulfarculaceae bacterium]